MTSAAGPIAIVYCQGAFATLNGKTAHGLVRRSRRYRVASVIDSRYAGRDAGEVLDDRTAGIPVLSDLDEALARCESEGSPATHFVIGLAPDGGRLPPEGRRAVASALERGLHVVSGLHDFLGEDPELTALAERHGVTITDVRRPPPRSELHFFTGKIDDAKCLRVALLGTDSAIGKRTTSWLLVDAFEALGHRAEMIGTGQTAWLQGARYSILLDSLVSDFITGELEHAILEAWREQKPEVVVVEGQGGLMNPAYPGGLEIVAASRPQVIVLQHAPARKEYDGVPGFGIHPLPLQIEVLEKLTGKPVVAITINHEDLAGRDAIEQARREIEAQTGRPAFDVLLDGAQGLAEVLLPHLEAATSTETR